MAGRLRAHLPRLAALVVLGVCLTATLTYAAGRKLGGGAVPPATTPAPSPPLTVPDVKGQAFVFAKGSLEDAGFAWRVVGSVHGFAANTVAAQSPAAGTRVLDTGAPLITLTLKRNSGYTQGGSAEDVAPYQASVLQPADLAAAVGPAHAATTTTATTTATTTTTATATTAPAVTTTSTATQPTTTAAAPAKPAARTTAAKTTWPRNRPPAFNVPGARKEPLDEMPLTNRAQLLLTWLQHNPRKTNRNVKYWLYQNSWIVTGARLGWWRGADALTTLIAADRRAVELWGIGSRSAAVAERALSVVESKAK
jgi:PASTA domain